MKKLILLAAAILISCQLLVGQMSRLETPEFSVWVKTEYVTNLTNNCDNSVVSVVSDICLGRVAQTRKQAAVPWKITAVAVFVVATEAMGDACYDQGKQDGNQNQIMLGKALQAISLGSHFLYIPIMKDSNTPWFWVPVVEIGWRITGFDLIYNATRGLPAGHIGNTSYWDRGMQSFAPPTGMRLFADCMFATFTIKITFDKF